jgi:peptide/nickel transport system ATP-binding protein
MTNLLSIEHLRVDYLSSSGSVTAIPDLSLDIRRGESYGLVGESGCGKSTLLMAVLAYLGATGRISNGRILFDGQDLVAASPAELVRLRGRGISIVYQDPAAALNPTMTIGRQLMEVPLLHEKVSIETARAKVRQILADVHLPDPDSLMQRYPHQLSGGQKQRVVIAMALLASPKLLLLDEPTTGLDVTVEAAVLDLVNELRVKFGTTLLYISHNLGVIAKVCDRVGIMYLGELVEEAPVRQIFADPKHFYTRRLLACLPRLDTDKHEATLQPIPGQPPGLAQRPTGCGFGARCARFDQTLCGSGPIPLLTLAENHQARCVRTALADIPDATSAPQPPSSSAPVATAPVLTARGLSLIYDLRRSIVRAGKRIALTVKANEDLNFTAGRGEILAIVGESGSGKSSFARVLAGLQPATGGALRVLGDDIGKLPASRRSMDLLAAVQMVFQNPDATLNPSHSAGYPIKRALRKFGITRGKQETEKRLAELFEMVRLPLALSRQKPLRLSGGQKQRVAIARAFAGNPQILIADEPVSALDVSVQAAIVNLLMQIQAQNGATIVFISHDLALVRHLADKVVVLYLGRIMEQGPVKALFQPPYHPYTEALLAAVPVADPEKQRPRIPLEGEIPSPIHLPVGCRFTSRCPRKLGPICDTTPPPEQEAGDGHIIACHIPLAELTAAQTPIA